MVLSPYEEELEKRVRQALNAGSQSLETICREVGAFPVSVTSCLDRMGIRIDSLSKESASDPVLLDLPEPHPIDFDWRFTRDTTERVADSIALSADRIACFGTPSIFEALLRRGKEVLLVDQNPFLFPDNEFAFHTDLTSDQSIFPAETFDSVVIDAPWYSDHMLTWFAKALPILKPGGTIIFTVFPALIRPSGELERDELLQKLETLGDISPVEVAALYQTPRFELETLRAHGLPDLHSWRRTSFFALHVRRPHRLHVRPIESLNWHRFVIDSQVIAVRGDVSGDRIGDVEAPYSDGSFVLRSVSARDPIRARINVWTSRNRALRVHAPSKLLRFFAAIRDGASVDEGIKETSSNETERQSLRAIWESLEIGRQDAVRHTPV